MESEEKETSQESGDMPHGHEGSDRTTEESGQVGVGVGGLGGGQPGGTMTDQGRGYGAEGGAARKESAEEDMPHAHEGQERGGAEVGAGSGGLGGQEWSGRREESSGQGDDMEKESS
jgi:hypothetical protein